MTKFIAFIVLTGILYLVFAFITLNMCWIVGYNGTFAMLRAVYIIIEGIILINIILE